MRPLHLFLIFLVSLTACAVPAQPTLAPEDINGPKSESPTLDGTFGASLLVNVWRGSSEGNMLFPLDPATGTALPEYPEIALGETFFYALSPDRQTMAVASFPSQSMYSGSLFLIDLPAWKTRELDVELSGWVSTMLFSPDGKKLVIAHGETNFKLTMVNLEEGAITAQIPTYSYISRMRFNQSGEALMLYRSTVDTANSWIGGPPQVLLLNTADLTTLWSTELTGVRDGIFPREEGVTESNYYEPGKAYYISPGLVFAPDRDALYIVHADSEQLTTVDFAKQRVETVDVQPRLTWFERLLSLTARVAYAKIGDGLTRQAAISPDGQFLYVTGVNNSTFLDKQGNWQMEQTPLGLEIIQTSDGSRLSHIESDTTELSISPDGRFLYLRNWGTGPKYLPWTEIFDTASQQVVAGKDNISAIPAFTMNGKFLLVSTFSTGEYSHHMSILEPDGSKVLAEWTDSWSVWWLTSP